MKKVIPVLIALLFILSAIFPIATAVEGEVHEYTENIDDASGMDERRGGYYDEDFCWTHTFDPSNKYLLYAELTIGVWDIDYVSAGEIVKIHVDGTYIGDLDDTGNDLFGTTTFTITDYSIFDDGDVEVCVEFDDREGYEATIDWSELYVEYQPHIIVEKWNHGDEFVPVETEVEFPLEIYVKNPDTDADDDLTDVVVYDGIGAEFDLVLYNSDHTEDADGMVDDAGDYFFKIDDIPVAPVIGTTYYGFSGNIYWWQASEKAYNKMMAGKGKGCATVIMWTVGTLSEDSAISLEFTIETKDWWTGNHRHHKQSFTSTCHHTLNDGPYVYYDIDPDSYWIKGEPVEVSVYSEEEGADTDGDGWYDLLEVNIYGTDPCDDEDYPESFRLIEKDPDTWDPVHDPVTDGPYGILTYDPIGPTFDFDFEGWNLETDEDYTLIYYANPWPGDNPGALLGTGTSDGGGYIYISDNIELNMDLPHPDDDNHPVNSPVIPGAKIWLVLTSDYDDINTKMTGWQPAEYLFEEETWDRVFYDDTDV